MLSPVWDFAVLYTFSVLGVSANAEGHRQDTGPAMPVEDGLALPVHAGATHPPQSAKELRMSAISEEFFRNSVAPMRARNSLPSRIQLRSVPPPGLPGHQVARNIVGVQAWLLTHPKASPKPDSQTAACRSSVITAEKIRQDAQDPMRKRRSVPTTGHRETSQYDHGKDAACTLGLHEASVVGESIDTRGVDRSCRICLIWVI